jgi:predicted aminopeptidase
MILDIKSVSRGFFNLSILVGFFSCAKISYVIDQGVGQLRIVNRAKPNSEVLLDAKISEADKSKIKKIADYKKYFYQYYSRKSTGIYDKTYFLSDRAISYLVIASEKNIIKAKEECFPIMGCFPYLGFYKVDDAKVYAKRLEDKGLSTFIRPVYAYSTLGYFTDPILSSFFIYNEHELAELIFHELFHTIFFIKGEVELNENLANYFGRELSVEYFKMSSDQRANWEKEDEFDHELNSFILKKIEGLKNLYKNSAQGEKEQLQSFLDRDFYPDLKALCNREKRPCQNLLTPWNNARFAAYLTYEKKSDAIKKLHLRLNLTLKDFFLYIENSYKQFKDQGDIKNFSDYLLGKEEV